MCLYYHAFLPVRPICAIQLLLQILADIIFNSLAITACFLAAGMTGIYGAAVQMDDFDNLLGGCVSVVYSIVADQSGTWGLP